jgi:hypothetical protein
MLDPILTPALVIGKEKLVSHNAESSERSAGSVTRSAPKTPRRVTRATKIQ